MKLSLILPVYNVSKYIERCLESILCQNHGDIEIIIVDDESPDDSIIKVKPYLSLYENLNIIHQKNRGLGGARNTGLRHAKGDYIWFIDSDDEMCEDSINFLLNIIDGEDVIICNYQKIEKSGSIINDIRYPKVLRHLSGPQMEQFVHLSQAWKSLYKRNFLLSNELFFREKFLHEDGEFNMRVMCLAKDVTYYPKCIYKYYTSNFGSIMNTIKLKNEKDLLIYFDTVDELHAKYDLDELQKKVLMSNLISAMMVFFKNAIFLSESDFISFRSLLKRNRSRIRRNISFTNASLYSRMLFEIQLNFSFRFVYNIIYNKHL